MGYGRGGGHGEPKAEEARANTRSQMPQSNLAARRSIWNAHDQRELTERIARLTPSAPRRWGKMDARQMVMHLCESFKMATGELPVASKHLPIRYTPLKQLIIYWLPFPKNAPTAPELISRAPADWESGVRELQSRFDAFVRRGEAENPEHPAFGKLTHKQWGVLAYRHMDHHLRQFGV